MTPDQVEEKETQDSDEISDGSLLRQFRLGDQKAATQLHGRYVERLRNLAQNNLSANLARRIDAEDIVQSAFRCFFQAVSQGSYDLPKGEDLWALLMVITLNRLRVAKGHHRAAKRDVRVTADVGSFDFSGLMAGKKDDDTTAFFRIVLREALERLPSHYRTVIQLRMEGYEVAEIAQSVNRSKRTVERVLQEARNQLRIFLEEEESHDEPSRPANVAGD